MADKKFELLKEKAQKRSGLTEIMSFKMSSDEMDILKKKAAILDVELGELVREYVLDTSLFDNSPFEEKKAKKAVKKVIDKVGES